MKLRRPLSPPLPHIERKLFGVNTDLIHAVLRNETSSAIARSVRESDEWREFHAAIADAEKMEKMDHIVPIKMPSALTYLVRKRISAQNAHDGRDDLIPASGQIVEVCQVKTPKVRQLDWFMQSPLYVLLDEKAEIDSLWHGWLVSGEVDYATWWDFVLQEEDEPFPSEAAMVQIWNPVQIYLPMAEQVVARLSQARLQAVRALALEYLSGAPLDKPPVWPGRVAQRVTESGFNVVTGSPLGGESDPRHEYRHFYHYAAEAIREPARLALLESERAPSGISVLVEKLLQTAKACGASLWPEPQIANAMGPTDVQNDLIWGKDGFEYARIRVERLEDKAGCVNIKALGEQPVSAKIMVADCVENQLVASPGQDPVKLYWEDRPMTRLVLSVDNEQLELPLVY